MLRGEGECYQMISTTPHFFLSESKVFFFNLNKERIINQNGPCKHLDGRCITTLAFI